MSCPLKAKGFEKALYQQVQRLHYYYTVHTTEFKRRLTEGLETKALDIDR